LTIFYIHLAIYLINKSEFSWKTPNCLCDPKPLNGSVPVALCRLFAVCPFLSVTSCLRSQSTLGYIALLIATAHGLLFGWKRAFEEGAYRFYLPPGFVVALALPVCVILGKVLMLLPCVARKLHGIRRGLDTGRRHRGQRLEPMGSAAHVSPERVTVM